MGALTIMFPLAASFPSVKTPIFTYYLRRKKTTKQNKKALCSGMYYILGCFLDGIGSACM